MNKKENEKLQKVSADKVAGGRVERFKRGKGKNATFTYRVFDNDTGKLINEFKKAADARHFDTNYHGKDNNDKEKKFLEL